MSAIPELILLNAGVAVSELLISKVRRLIRALADSAEATTSLAAHDVLGIDPDGPGSGQLIRNRLEGGVQAAALEVRLVLGEILAVVTRQEFEDLKKRVIGNLRLSLTGGDEDE